MQCKIFRNTCAARGFDLMRAITSCIAFLRTWLDLSCKRPITSCNKPFCLGRGRAFNMQTSQAESTNEMVIKLLNRYIHDMLTSSWTPLALKCSHNILQWHILVIVTIKFLYWQLIYVNKTRAQLSVHELPDICAKWIPDYRNKFAYGLSAS